MTGRRGLSGKRDNLYGREGNEFMFFLVSGATASGKSTVAKGLPLHLENTICHEYDEKKVTDEDVRCQQLEEWIQCALDHQKECVDFLPASHSPLGELLACPSARKLEGILACLLDCSDITRIQRIRERRFDSQMASNVGQTGIRVIKDGGSM